MIYEISKANWPDFSSNLSASVFFERRENNLLLRYFVEEPETVAVETGFNSPVYRDSCVEFFVAFDETGYYNLEFNATGAVLGEFGTCRNNRSFIPSDILSAIDVRPSLGNNPFQLRSEKTNWALEILIPKEVFFHHRFDSFSEIQMKGNFYKCGDNLPKRHYLSTFPIDSDRPDFHRPDFFRELD